MGAIERNGYIFEIEYSQIDKMAALHVYENGEFVDELTFNYKGEMPEQEEIEEKIEQFIKKRT